MDGYLLISEVWLRKLGFFFFYDFAVIRLGKVIEEGVGRGSRWYRCGDFLIRAGVNVALRQSVVIYPVVLLGGRDGMYAGSGPSSTHLCKYTVSMQHV